MKRILLMLAGCCFSLTLLASPSPNTFVCFGNEPFWVIKINPNRFEYQKMYGPKTLMKPVKPRRAQGRSPDFIKVYNTYTLRDNTHATIIMTHNPHGCSDSMSDREHQYDLVVVFPRKVLAGCCNLVPPKKH